MVNKKKSSKTKRKKEKKHIIDFGKLHDHIQVGEEIKKLHELTEQEKKLLVEDFKKIKGVKKEEEAELKAVKYFEKKLQELIENVVYMEGYIQQIEQGNSMLKINPSVKELGKKLVQNVEEVEKLSASMIEEERKILGLVKHVKLILDKAKKYQNVLFG